MEIEIRKANPKDAKTIIDFQMLMAKETENIDLDPVVLEKGVNAIFTNPAFGQYYIASYEGKTVASLMTTFEWSDWRYSMVWWLQSVYVLPEYRKSGIFRKMYSYIKNEVMHRPEVSGLRLYMVHSNHRAASVYEAVGMDGQHYRMFEWMKDF